MTKSELMDKAKSALNNKNVKEAASYFNQVLQDYSENLEGWDVFHMLKCTRMGGKIEAIDALAEDFKDFSPVKNIYAWHLYDQHVKNFSNSNLDEHEKGIEKISELIEQKDFNSDDSDDVPCAYTMGVLKMVKAFRKPNINIDKVSYWIGKLDPLKLSDREFVFNDKTGKERRLASDLEDYYSSLSDLKLKKGDYQECIEACDEALKTIKKFHYDNDIWFKRRKALSLISSGQEEDGFKLLLALSENRKGDKWFIYSEIGKIYFEHEEYDKSIEYCKKGISATGDEAYKINLLILTARCLFKLNNLEDAEIVAHYVAGISLINELKEKQDIQRIFSYFNIKLNKVENPKQYLSMYRKKVDELFDIDRNRNNKGKISHHRRNKGQENEIEGEKISGIIKVVHANGKSGHVTANSKDYFFGMRDVRVDKNKLDRGVEVKIILKDARDKQGNPEQHAIIVELVN